MNFAFHAERARQTLPKIWLLVFVLVVLKVSLAGHLLLNITGSIPRGLYWITPGQSPRRGQLITFPIPESVRELIYERHYLPQSVKLLAKPAAAIAGDHVCVNDDQLVINGVRISEVCPNDRQGLRMPRHPICRTLGSTEVFAATEHANSFDSRYFGPIDRSTLRGTLTPIFTAD